MMSSRDGNPTDEELRKRLSEAKRIAVVGLSANSERDSYRVARYLQNQGYEIVPVNPTVEQVLGSVAFKTLREVPGHIDIVDIFRKPEAVAAIVDEAISIGAGAIWMQLGVTDEPSGQKARRQGLMVVQSRCIKIEHARLFG